MLTKKGKYGLKALVDLAQLEPGETAFITEIATRNNIPKKCPGGGYSLSRPASDIRIGQVIRTLDGPLAPIRCASRTAFEACDDCADPVNCHVRKSMSNVRDAIASILDNMTLEQFAANDNASEIVALRDAEAG